jgi:glycosyltransferase involved in cell wall biosynthesis
MARIVVLASYAPSLVLFRGTLLRILAERSYAVIACAPADDSVATQLSKFGIHFEDVGPSRTSINPFRDLLYCFQLFRLLRRVKPNIVFAYTIKPVIWGAIISFVLRIPRICVMITGLGHTFVDPSRTRTIIGRGVRALYKLALRCAHRIAFQNPDDMREFFRLGLITNRSKAFVVNGSGIELQKFTPAPIPGQLVFLLIARLLSDKGIREYAEAARRVKRKYPTVAFRLVGWFDSNPTTISREEVANWTNEGIIDFRGFKEDVRQEIAAASVYVLPSYREGTPRTVLEAMAMARPIITTDVPGCRETVVTGDNGFLVPVRDSVALAVAMERFVDDPGIILKMGQRSRILAESKYDAVKVAETLIQGLRLES